MRSSPEKENDLLHKFAERARRHGDSKSIFGLLLLIERELRSEALEQISPPTHLKDTQTPDGQKGM
jgi:hypothetical protein